MLKKSFSALTVTLALGGTALLPVAAQAQGVELRFYDRSHKDYHHWNSNEDRFYREVLARASPQVPLVFPDEQESAARLLAVAPRPRRKVGDRRDHR